VDNKEMAMTTQSETEQLVKAAARALKLLPPARNEQEVQYRAANPAWAMRGAGYDYVDGAWTKAVA
jgi:hypothetical protein